MKPSAAGGTDLSGGIDDSPDRWFGVGSSAASDSATAGAVAIRQALRYDDARLVTVFCSPRLAVDEVVDAIAAAVPGVPMIGCTTAGEIATGSAGDASVTVAVLGGEFAVTTGCARGASDDLHDAGMRAAAAAAQPCVAEHQILLLLTDGLGGNQQEVVRGAYAYSGAAVPMVGGCAGDDSAMVQTLQIFDGEVLRDSVVAASVGSGSPMGIGVRHGWRKVGEPMLVSRSDETRVYELDGRPAVDVYVDRGGAPSGIEGDVAAFAQFAATHPLGLSRRAIEEVRFIAGSEEGALISIAEVPQGTLVWLMEGDQASVLAGTEASCQEALAALHGRDPIGMFMFDCVARRLVLGPDGVTEEMAAIGKTLPAVPTAGFYTYGEIARTRGVRGFHNQTLVTLALS